MFSFPLKTSKVVANALQLRVDRLSLGPSNAWLVHGPKGLLLVDAGVPWSARRILKALSAIPGASLAMIYITHAHIDHYGAAAAVRAATGARIFIHTADADDLAAGATHLGHVRDWSWSPRALTALEGALRVAPIRADIQVQDGTTMRECGLEMEVLHTPGHTPGSSTLIVNDPASGGTIAFAGDLVLTSGGAHVQRTFAVDWGLVRRSLARLQAKSPDVVFPGHGRRALCGPEFAALKVTGPARSC